MQAIFQHSKPFSRYSRSNIKKSTDIHGYRIRVYQFTNTNFDKLPAFVNPLSFQISVAISSRFKNIGEKLIFTSLSIQKLPRIARKNNKVLRVAREALMKHSSNKIINQNFLIKQ